MAKITVLKNVVPKHKGSYTYLKITGIQEMPIFNHQEFRELWVK